MAVIVRARVQESSTTTGTGAITLAGAVAGFRTFASVCSTSDTFDYLIEAVDANGTPTGQWEIGSGTYSGTNTLTRTTPSDGSAATPVNFTGGNLRVSLVHPTVAQAVLGANTFTADQILSDNVLSRAMLKDCGVTAVDKGNSGTSTQTLDYTAGSSQKITATGNHTIATSNWPPTGNLGAILLELVNGGAYTITWPTINWIKPDGTTTTSISTFLAANTGRTALQTSGTDQLLLWSKDGTTIYGKLI